MREVIRDVTILKAVADGPVLAGPTFTQGKNKITILHEASNMQKC